jgi:hypothetical protein
MQSGDPLLIELEERKDADRSAVSYRVKKRRAQADWRNRSVAHQQVILADIKSEVLRIRYFE